MLLLKSGLVTSGLVTEVLYDWDKVGADVLFHVCPQICMPNTVEVLLKVYRHSRGLADAGDISHRGFLG